MYQLRWDGQSTGPDIAALGWGISFSGREYFGRNKHYFLWLTSYGNGWGSNVISTIGTNTAAIITPDEKLETMPAWNLSAGFALNLSPVLMANVNTAWFGINPSVYRSEDKIKSGGSGHINLIWSPFKSVNAGIEYMILRRVNVSEDYGWGNRLQFMIKYLF